MWDAIATGPGVDSWFMGHTTIEPGVGGRTSFDMLGAVSHSTVTAWEPGKRFAYREDDAPEGTFMALEYFIEAKDGGSTVLRFVHSGLIAGDDWEAEYHALRDGVVAVLIVVLALLFGLAALLIVRRRAVAPHTTGPPVPTVHDGFGSAEPRASDADGQVGVTNTALARCLQIAAAAC